jgi:inorganic pyrophosphatase
VLRVEQKDPASGGRQRNDRVLTAPMKTRHGGEGDVDARLRAQLEQFFTAAVAFERKDLRLLGWGDANEADALVRAAEASTGAAPEHK